MAAVAEKDTVWIGFMDIVPVIGTLKEAVELVLAVYEGNKAVINEKEKAAENIVKKSSKQHVKLAPPDKPAAAAAEFSGLGNVREVRKEKIIEYMVKGSKKGTKPLAEAEKKQRERKVEEIKRDMLKKIHLINQNFSGSLKEQLGRPNRGDHVFNNSILRFHSDVLTNFIQAHHIDNLPGYNQQTMDALGRHTLTQNTAAEIQTNMVVHFDENEFYVNANAVMYGEYCRALREALLNVLRHRNLDDVTEQERDWVIFIIDNMNNHEIYVDNLAKVKWIGNRQDRQTRFNTVKQEVVHMYNTDRGFDWCRRILDVVAPLFGF